MTANSDPGALDPSLESSALIRLAKEGSREAMDRLFERFGPRLLALIRLRMGRSLRDHLESRDILQSTLLKAFQHLDRFESSRSRSLLAWLVRIAENEIRDQADYRGAKRRDLGRNVPLDDAVEGLEAELQSQVTRIFLSEESTRLERALEALPEAHREVIVLRKLEELSFREIGERLGRRPDACRMLLARALAALVVKMRETK